MRLAVIVVGCTLVHNAAADRAGKVVRVERPRGSSPVPRECGVMRDLHGFCLSADRPVEIGDRITLVGREKVTAVVRVAKAELMTGTCNQNAIWEIETTLDSGDPSFSQGKTVGVLDLDVDPQRGKTIAVDHSPTGRALGPDFDQVDAIDADGDGRIDVEFIQYPCDDAAAPSQTPTATCIETWGAGNGRGLARLHADWLKNCL